MEGMDFVDWVISKDAREILLVAAIIGSTIFLLYGIFNGRPPFFKEADLDEKGRRVSLILGFIFMGVFFLTLTIPLTYDLFIYDSYQLYIDSHPVKDGTKIMAINEKGLRVNGSISVKKAGKPKSKPLLTLPSYSEDVSIYKLPIRILGKTVEKYREIARGGEDRVYISDNRGKINGPIQIIDANNNVIKEIPVFNYGHIFIPDDAKVEIYNATLLWREGLEEPKKCSIGSKIDPQKYYYGEHEELLLDWQVPKTKSILMISDKFRDKPMASGIKYVPDRLVASSNLFPLSTELLVSNPLIKGRPIRIVVQDVTKDGELALSSGAFKKLQFEMGGKPLADVQVVDYLAKIPK